MRTTIPDLIPHLSTCKSPQQMFGAVLKTYFAEKQGIDPSEIMSVSVMPCTAKKYEIGRPHQDASGVPGCGRVPDDEGAGPDDPDRRH